MGRSRDGYGSKFHLATDSQGLPLAAHVTAGQVHESTQFEAVMDLVRVPQAAGRPRTRQVHLAGDKGYSYSRIRAWLRRHAIKALVTQRSDQLEYHKDRPLLFDRETY